MEQSLVKKENLVGATLLVSGCCIGAGMIGLPVVSAMAGFIPSTVTMMICYFFATMTGLLILEATLWFKERVNLLTLAEFALGKVGRMATWSLFLFLFYCLFVAYIDAGGQLFAKLLSSITGREFGREVGMLICIALVSSVAYAGTHFVANLNRVLMCGIALTYCMLVLMGLGYVTGENLLFTNWSASLAAIPIFLVCFGYQNMVPTLTYYTKRNVNTMRIAIFVGNMIPFVIYFIWNFVILGMLPAMNTPEFASIVGRADMVSGLLDRTGRPDLIFIAVESFTFFALLTPFIANTVSFVDFLKDGFKMQSGSKYEIFIYALVLVPPTIFSYFYPHIFLKALSLVGGFADVLLLGVIPVLVVWIGRYKKKMQGTYTAPGGKLLLVVIFLLSVSCLFIKG